MMSNTDFRFGIASQKTLEREYMAEMNAICEATGRPDFEALISQLAEYDSFLESRRNLETDAADILRQCNEKLDVSIRSQRVQLIPDALCFANLACACHLLHGSALSLEQYRPEILRQLAGQFLESCRNRDDEYRQRLFNKFHTMDAIRTFHFLRSMGLVTTRSEDMYQLGLGTAEGTRDVISIHLQPDISVAESGSGKMVSLAQRERRAAETIIVDAGEMYREHYDQLNADESSNARGYCIDTIEFLANHEEYFDRKRNLVTALRIDHRMLPDVRKFFSLLAGCIDNDCDLVMTIGAGDVIEDFKGRLDRFREICATLKSVGLNPVIFKLYRDTGSYDKRRNSLYYGNIRASSYETIYCQLQPEALRRL